MSKWGDLKNRIDVWKKLDEANEETSLNEKSANLYEIMTILSALCCGSLIGLSNTNNNNVIIIGFYDILRGYGIITSVFSGIISVTYCCLINATTNKDTIIFLEKTNKFSNIPFFGIIFSLICLTLCTSLHFKLYIMIATLPYSIIVILYSLYFYDSLHKIIYELTHKIELNNNNTINIIKYESRNE